MTCMGVTPARESLMPLTPEQGNGSTGNEGQLQSWSREALRSTGNEGQLHIRSRETGAQGMRVSCRAVSWSRDAGAQGMSWSRFSSRGQKLQQVQQQQVQQQQRPEAAAGSAAEGRSWSSVWSGIKHRLICFKCLHS